MQSKTLFEISHLQVIFPKTRKGNHSKIIKPSKGNVPTNVSKTDIEVPKPSTKSKNVDSYNLKQTLESMHACDKPHSEDNIEKIIGEKLL